MTLDEQMEVFMRGTAEIISPEELRKKIQKANQEKRPLRIKLGVDPSAPEIHLGHTVPLRKLRQLQEIGHEIVFLIGDFTGRIGDPSGRSETRKQLTEEEMAINAKTYTDQVFKILDPEKTIVEYNSRWLGALTFTEVVQLAAKTTVARILERDDFATRFSENRPIGLHEFLYPLMQGYDSVALKADVELGGTDQKFNLLMGRQLQRDFGQEPQICLTLPILEGIDGNQKMSKSLGNYIGIDEAPAEMYGKTMAIPDEIMLKYYELVTDIPMSEIRGIESGLKDGSIHPRNAKMRLAREIVTLYHGSVAAKEAEEAFKTVFQQGDIPDDVPEFSLPNELLDENGSIWIVRLLTSLKLCNSSSEARRLIRQGAVSIDNQKQQDPEAHIKTRKGLLVRVGKRRFARLT
ncbi:MAG TPA: tyrosine--tRNA ligase [Firmicutes bacterium]|nr:tyrosine--tRNA ligase [Bacillota bacterium]